MPHREQIIGFLGEKVDTGGYINDTNQLDKEITKYTTDTSQLSQSSQHPRQGPTKLQKGLSRRRTGHVSEYQMFFLLVFLKDKFM